jgi:hypothetical protein
MPSGSEQELAAVLAPIPGHHRSGRMMICTFWVELRGFDSLTPSIRNEIPTVGR